MEPPAAAGTQHPDNHAHRGALPGSIQPEQSDHFAGTRRQRERPDRGDPRGSRSARASALAGHRCDRLPRLRHRRPVGDPARPRLRARPRGAGGRLPRRLSRQLAADPGRARVLDGGLAGALVLYGTPPATAAAAVLVYHAIALWIPAAGGLIAYARLRRSLLEQEPAQVRRPARALRGAPDCQSSPSCQPARRLRSSDLPSSAPLRLAPWARRKKSARSLSPSRSAS